MKTPACFSLSEIRRQDKSFAAVSGIYDEIKRVTKAAFSEKPDQVIFIGCGSSYYLAAANTSFFIENVDIPAFYLPCYELELNYESYIKGRKTLIIPFTRCSTTTEVKSVISKLRKLPNVKSLAITCDEGSRDYNDYVIYCSDSDEKSIVMTSSFTSLLYAGMLMTCALSGRDASKLLTISESAAKYIPEIEEEMKELSKKLSEKKLLVSLAQGNFFALAGETSIKLKEMCIIPTEVYFTLEYRHGPISIADKDAVCLLYTSDKTAKDDLRLVKELKTLGATVICIGYSVSDELKTIADKSLDVPKKDNVGLLPLAIIPAQFLGVYWALEKGIDPDVPKNLSKAIIL